MALFLNPYGAAPRDRLKFAADWLAAGVFLTLPWSTSATGILVALFVVAVIPTLERSDLREGLSNPAVLLPVLLWAAACLGMLWADVPWAGRLDGLRPFHKLLVLWLLLLHFRRSPNGVRVAAMFLVSTLLLLAYSWLSWWWPQLVIGARQPGVPVKDTIFQGMSFVLAATILIYVTVHLARAGYTLLAAGCALLVLLIFANLAYVANARTALAVLPALLIIAGFHLFGKRGAGIAIACAVALGGVGWGTSPYLRDRVSAAVDGAVQAPIGPKAETSEGLRREFWRESWNAVVAAPLFGHGTGSVKASLAKASAGSPNAQAHITDNPHNQTLFVAVQLGLFGVLILYAMWFFHFMLFRRDDWLAHLGTLVVVQNVISSLFNSHLADFTSGWLYVVSVGVLGGTLLGGRRPVGQAMIPASGAHSSAIPAPVKSRA